MASCIKVFLKKCTRYPKIEGQDEKEDGSSTHEAYQESQPIFNLFVNLI